MSRVAELEDAVRKLSCEELIAFRQWFEEFDAQAWDRQMEADAQAGKLDALAEEALKDYQAGGPRRFESSCLVCLLGLLPCPAASGPRTG
jgi:hypothetical protein